jgi:hypothetical protein
MQCLALWHHQALASPSRGPAQQSHSLEDCELATQGASAYRTLAKIAATITVVATPNNMPNPRMIAVDWCSNQSNNPVHGTEQRQQGPLKRQQHFPHHG